MLEWLHEPISVTPWQLFLFYLGYLVGGFLYHIIKEIVQYAR